MKGFALDKKNGCLWFFTPDTGSRFFLRLMYVTYSELFAFVTMIATVIGVVISAYNKKK